MGSIGDNGFIMNKIRTRQNRNYEDIVYTCKIFCPSCCQTKPINMFNSRQRYGDGKDYYDYCKTCIKVKRKESYKNNPAVYKSYNLKSEYGITLEHKLKIIESQNGKCAACGTIDHKGKYSGITGWSLDHKHDETKKIRGILCFPCNMVLGYVKDSSAHLYSLIDYLEKSA